MTNGAKGGESPAPSPSSLFNSASPGRQRAQTLTTASAPLALHLLRHHLLGPHNDTPPPSPSTPYHISMTLCKRPVLTGRVSPGPSQASSKCSGDRSQPASLTHPLTPAPAFRWPCVLGAAGSKGHLRERRLGFQRRLAPYLYLIQITCRPRGLQSSAFPPALPPTGSGPQPP